MTTSIDILDSGHVNRDDSAFPTLVRLNNGDIICGFSVGGGPEVTGDTHRARSVDGGKTWNHEGTILPRGKDPLTVNHLRLSRTRDEVVIAYGARGYPKGERSQFGKQRNEPVFCLSLDQGLTWSDPQVIQTECEGPFEISNPIVVLADGRWLAPAATLPDAQHLGESVIAFESPDRGKTWPVARAVFKDPENIKGFFEQKIIELQPGILLAVAWTVSMGDYTDFEDHFAFSNDGGRTWTSAVSTGIRGQTMNPFWLGNDRLLVVYNSRYGDQGVIICLVRFTRDAWEVEEQQFLWDARTTREREPEVKSGIDEFDDFAFGFPSVMRLDSHHFLAVHWCKEDDIFGIRWTRLRLG